MGTNGGVWQVFDLVIGPSGFLGLRAWTVMAMLAVTLWGFVRVARWFLGPVRIVDLGRLTIFAVFSYVVISSGSELMISVEAWRGSLGNTIYKVTSQTGSLDLDMPASSDSNDEPMGNVSDLDGDGLIRGWEAVATTYFLVESEAELNSNIPPARFRRAYCLYDPGETIDDQDDQNAEGCSPRIAWDEWDMVGTGAITEVWGIPLPTVDLPIIQGHPENRELGIRQAQSGISRLALGPLVALYPMLEANLSLMLALSAAVVYLALPIMLMFGFFIPTESMATRLMMQFLRIMISTVILNGLIALFQILLIKSSVNGSLSSYLGLVGVTVIGGIILTRVAAGTLKDTLSMAMSSIGSVWTGGATVLLGQSAAKPARTMLGAAKMVGAGALMATAGLNAIDLAEHSVQAGRSGLRDVNSGTGGGVDSARQYTAGRLPGPLAKIASAGLDTSQEAEADPRRISGQSLFQSHQVNGAVQPVGGQGGQASSNGSGLAGAGALAAMWPSQPPNGKGQNNNGVQQQGHVVGGQPGQDERAAVWHVSQQVAQQDQAGQYRRDDGSWTEAGVQAVTERLNTGSAARSFRGDRGQQDLATLLAAQQTDTTARGWGVPEARQGRVDQWVDQAYGARDSGQGGRRVERVGQDTFGEQLTGDAGLAISRHSQAETEAVLGATRQVAQGLPPEAMLGPDGQLTEIGQSAIRDRLEPGMRKSFRGRRGERDLAALSAMALQREKTAEPETFRHEVAEAHGGAGDQAPGRVIPANLGLDPVAAGPYYSNMNHFAQIGDQAGLRPEQRRRLLDEVNQTGNASPELRAEIKTSMNRQGAGRLTVDDVVDGARALPGTIAGPMAIQPEVNRDSTANQAAAGEGLRPAQAGALALAGTGAALVGATAAGEVRGRLIAQEQRTEDQRTGVADQLRAQAQTDGESVGASDQEEWGATDDLKLRAKVTAAAAAGTAWDLVGGAALVGSAVASAGFGALPAYAADKAADMAFTKTATAAVNASFSQRELQHMGASLNEDSGRYEWSPGLATSIASLATPTSAFTNSMVAASVSNLNAGADEQENTASNEAPNLREQLVAEGEETNEGKEDGDDQQQSASRQGDLPVLSYETVSADQEGQPAEVTANVAGDEDGNNRTAKEDPSIFPGNEQDSMPVGLGAVVDGQQVRNQTEATADDDGVRSLVDELKQVRAKDDGVQTQATLVIEPGQAASEGGEGKEKDGEVAAVRVGADDRPVILPDQQQRLNVETAGGEGGAGIAAALRQGRVDEGEGQGEANSGHRGKRKRKQDDDAMVDEAEMTAESVVVTDDYEGTTEIAERNDTSTRSLMPHHRQSQGRAEDSAREEQQPSTTGKNGSGEQSPPSRVFASDAATEPKKSSNKDKLPPGGKKKKRTPIADMETDVTTPGESSASGKSSVTGGRAGRTSGTAIPASFSGGQPQTGKKPKKRREPIPPKSSKQEVKQQSESAAPQSGSRPSTKKKQSRSPLKRTKSQSNE